MSTVHQGITSGKPSRVKELLLVPTGNSFASAEALSLGHAYVRGEEFETLVNEDFQTAHRPYAHNVTVDHETFRATFPMLKNLYLLQKNGFVDARLTMATTLDKWYFINDSTPATPNGSTNLGLAWEYVHTMTKVSLKAILTGQVTDGEIDWMADAVAASTGGAGTGTIGLTSGGFSLLADVPPNYRTIQLTNAAGAANIGATLNWEMSIKSSGKNDKDNVNRAMHQEFDWMIKGNSVTVTPAELKAWTTDTRGGASIIVTDALGRQIKFPAVPPKLKIMKRDDNHHIEWEFKGRTVQNSDEVNPDAFDIGVTDANILEIKNVGNT